jgi:hypothetical protein
MPRHEPEFFRRLPEDHALGHVLEDMHSRMHVIVL